MMGQDADALSLPHALRRFVLPLVPETALKRWQAHIGSFLFLTAGRPS